MGMVAVRGDAEELIDAFTDAWPTFEPKIRATMVGAGTLWNWIKDNERAVYGNAWSPDNPGTSAYGFWQDGEWAVMLDPDFVQAGDQPGLSRLSERFGLVLSFIVETAGGCAFFNAFERGRLLRSIDWNDGKFASQGDPLSQEAGLPAERYYVDETEQLQANFGITPIDRLSEDLPCAGAAFTDRTDYSALMHERAVRRASSDTKLDPLSGHASTARPWWKFW